MRVREDGASPEALIDALGFHRSCIYAWLKRYDEAGLEALKAKPIPGAPLKLAAWQGSWLRQIIVEKTPLVFGYAVALWTRAIVREVVQRELGMQASDATVGRWLSPPREISLSPIFVHYRVKECVAAQAGRLQRFYLPLYSPGLNPDEGVWSYVTHHGVGKQIARNKDELKRQVLSRLHSLQKLPEKVKNLFKAPSVQYILMDLEKSAI